MFIMCSFLLAVILFVAVEAVGNCFNFEHLLLIALHKVLCFLSYPVLI